jgi:hypothetical protein
MSLNFKDDDDNPDFKLTPADRPGTRTGEKKTVELWAAAKGLYPQFFAAPVAALPANTQPGPFGTVAVSMAGLVGPKANHEYWKFAAAKAMRAWPEGKETTEAEFDEAVAEAAGQVGR